MEGSLYVIKENQFLCKDCISTEEHSVSNWISTAPDCVVDTVGHGVGQCSKVGVRKGIPGSPHFCPQLGKSLGRPTLQQLLNPPEGVLHRHQVWACAGGHLAPHPGLLQEVGDAPGPVDCRLFMVEPEPRLLHHLQTSASVNLP